MGYSCWSSCRSGFILTVIPFYLIAPAQTTWNDALAVGELYTFKHGSHSLNVLIKHGSIRQTASPFRHHMYFVAKSLCVPAWILTMRSSLLERQGCKSGPQDSTSKWIRKLERGILETSHLFPAVAATFMQNSTFRSLCCHALKYRHVHTARGAMRNYGN